MADVLSTALNSIDAMGSNFSQQAYSTLGQELVPVMGAATTLYVAVYGVQLLIGATTLSGREIIIRVSKMMFIIGLVQSWGTFNTLFYSWLSGAPDHIGKALLTAGGSGVSDVTSGLSTVFEVARRAAASLARQSGYFAIMPSLIGWFILACTGLFVGIALALLILAKVMLWVLVGTGPMFIGCWLFDRTKGLGDSWAQQVLLYALVPIFVYVIAAFLISILNQSLSEISSAANSSTLKVTTLASLILVTIAGVYVLLNVQSLAQGIAGGLAINIGGFANGVAANPMKLAGKYLGGKAFGAARAGGRAAGGAAWRGTKSAFGFGNGGSMSASSSGASALQSHIKNQSSIK